MNDFRERILELEKQVKRIKRSKQKKHISEETMQHFKTVLSGIDELNRSVLKYDGTNVFLFAKLNNNSVASNYIQY